ncbi:hypothetical protein H4582DRAFT_838954 [Lactarius indigo]|nr:hypothetical protein H4582DRAFT_838954 [Lactarius indigo]
MNAVRAREVWEMDRLWKGRSMAYGLEGPHVVYAQSIGDVGSTTSVNGLGPGSTHTSYKLQQSFPFPTTATAAAAAAAAPGIYSSSPSPPHSQQPQAADDAFAVRVPVWREELSGPGDYPELSARRTAHRRSRRATRCPHPRASRRIALGRSQRPLLRGTTGTAAEYWSKYAGVGVVSSTH